MLGSIAFLIVLVLVIVIITIFRRKNQSDKCRERVNKIKKAIFYNPIIRFLILNSLKMDA